MVNASSFVRITYWEGTGLSSQLGLKGYFPGHVALELFFGNDAPSTYISFWPGTCGHPLCKEHRVSHFHPSKNIDQVIEHTPGEDTDLHSLNVGAMQTAFETFKAKPYSWGALGSSILRRSYERNCAGLALYLLEKGGVPTHPPKSLWRGYRKAYPGPTTIAISCIGLCSIRHLRTLFVVRILNIGLATPDNEAVVRSSHLIRTLRTTQFFLEAMYYLFFNVFEDKKVTLAQLIKEEPLYKFYKSIYSFERFTNGLVFDYEKFTELSEEAVNLQNSTQDETLKLGLSQLAHEASALSVYLGEKVFVAHQALLDLVPAFALAKKRYLYTTVASIMTIFLTMTFLYLNEKAWKKTVTPFKVNKIVKKMKQIEQQQI